MQNKSWEFRGCIVRTVHCTRGIFHDVGSSGSHSIRAPCKVEKMSQNEDTLLPMSVVSDGVMFKKSEGLADLNRKRDLELMKQEGKDLKVMLGVTVKAITENELDGILDIAYTLTVKLNSDKHGELSFNINKTGDEVPKYRNRRYGQNGVIEPYSGTSDLISCSAHMNSSVKVTSEVDLCPFVVTTYDLSIKLNALNEESERHKQKAIFVSRYLDDYLQLQPESIGRGVSRGDHISILGVSKKKKGADPSLPKMGITKTDGLWIELDYANYETDELIFRFTTRRKQVSNLVSVVFPCIVVPLVFGEISRRGSVGTDSLLTAVLTLVFAMPPDFGYGTAIWFAFAFTLCLASYAVNIPLFGLIIEILSVSLGFMLLAYMYRQQLHLIVSTNRGGHPLVDLVKDRSDEWKKFNLGEILCLV